jgi:LacI family transcriptional regulator
MFVHQRVAPGRMLGDCGVRRGEDRVARVTIQDVAREAAVSAATVDRVLNRREGVRPTTVARVEDAIRRLNYQPDRLAARLARARDYRFVFVLPSGSNTFMQILAAEVQDAVGRMVAERVVVELVTVDVFDAEKLAEALEAVGAERPDGVGVVALDHPSVREALNALADAGVPVVTLVSDVPNARRLHHVGIDNSAAGRTAATLLGRFVGPRRGKVGLIAGSLFLRDHAERQYGFEQVMHREFAKLEVLPVREGRDDYQRNEEVVTALLEETPDLVAIYNVGAGNRGVIAALEVAGRGRDVVYVAHELTQFTRRGLLRGTIDAVINQDPGHEVRSAIRVLTAHADGTPIVASQERIRIDIFIRDNVP